MKNKIHITNKAPQYSKMDLAEHMDFDALLKKGVPQKEPFNKNWKIAGLIFGLLSIGCLLGWYLNHTTTNRTENTVQAAEVVPENKINKSIPTIAEKEPSKDANINSEKSKDMLPPKIIASEKPFAPITQKEVFKKTQEIKITKNNITSPSQKAYDFIEAVPKDGMENLYDYLNSNLKYPAEVSSEKIEGQVLVNFTINKVGEIQDVKVEKSLGIYFDAEAIRVVKTMPAWIPATINGQNISSQLSIPLYFNVNE